MKNMNKWFYAFLAAAIVLVGAIVAIVIISVNANKPLPTPDYSEGEETGVYYYTVEQGEVILTLNSGNSFTIAGPDINKTGTYVINGSEIILDFFRDEDGTATATVADGKVTLTYNGATMSFIPKVNYTVSFSTDGGSAVESSKVENGKYASKPDDPTKEGYVFLGWFADSELKTPYNFGSCTVSADTTVYAKWAPVVVGQAEYIADFDLGYEGADPIADISTVGGKLYGVPTPERAGYTFGGWFISMYEDGQKLSYAYTEDLVLNSNTTLYAVWHNDDSTKLKAPAVSVSEAGVKWDNVGASTYKLVIKDSKGTVLLTEQLGSTTKNYSFESLPAGDYSVEVTAVANNTDNNSETTVRYFKNKALDRVSKFQVVDGVLIYNSVDGAEKYLITVDCGNDEHNHVLFDNGRSTNYNFSNCSMQPGGIKITVTAKALGYADSVSETFVYNRELSSVGSVIYDESKDAFLWNEVYGATNYIITVTADGKTYYVNNGNKTAFSVADYTGEITVSVVPVTDGYNSPEASVATCNKVVPATPSGITVVGMILSWNPVDGATSYEVKIGTQAVTVDTNSLELTPEQFNLAAGTVYTAQVKAVKGNLSSAYSDKVSFSYRSMNGALNYNNGTVYWTPVAGVKNYEVKVNDQESVRVSEATSVKVSFDRAGENVISVRFTDYGGSEWITLKVTAYKVTYMSRSLGGETVEFVAVGDTMSLPQDYEIAGYTFTGWYNAPNAAQGNGKEYTSTVFTGNGDMILYANWTPKTYKIEFQVDGYEITNVTNGAESDATYTKDFTLTVPVSSNELYGTFVGWFTGPAGSGTKLTDENGNSVGAYPYYRDTIAYPFFDTGILTFQTRADGTYAVKKGPNFSRVSHVTVPYSYNGVAVTAILENAFASCTNLVSIEIPSNIKLVGTGAFSGCTKLEAINSYEVEGNYEVFYTTSDGALLMHDMGTVYLEVFPRAKTGVYTVPSEVDIIRNMAFQYSYIDSVIISSGVSLVQEYAFYMCRTITSVEFEGGRTSPLTIEPYAFRSCSTLTKIKLPAYMNEMDVPGTLGRIVNLVTIEVEEGGTLYGSVDGMLTNAVRDTILYAPTVVSGSFTIPSGISGVGAYAFEGIKGITDVTVPSYVTSIGEGAFYGCSGISSVTFLGGRNSDLVIGKEAFAACEKLDTVTFLGGSTTNRGAISIGERAFAPKESYDTQGVFQEYVPSIDTVIFDDGVNVSRIGNYAFANQFDLYTLTFGDNIVITEIGESAFENAEHLTIVIIPASTTKIGDSAFAGCKNVARVEFEEGGTGIDFGSSCFENCVKLTTVYLPSTVAKFDGSAFAGCPAIAKIEVSKDNPNFETNEDGVLFDADYSTLIFYPKALDVTQDALDQLPWDKITKIGDAVFSANDKLESFYVRKGVTEIGSDAFSDCINLKTVTFEAGGSTLTVGAEAFYGCKALTGIDLPSYTTEIGASAFEKTTFKTFVIPENVTTIGYAAFKSSKITSIVIPAKVTYIADAAFASCSSLTSVIFQEGEKIVLGSADATSSTGVFFGSKITAVDFNNRVTSVGAYAFYKVTTIKSVNLGSCVTTINNYAFQGATGFKTVTIPKSVTYIGEYAFGSTSSSTASPDEILFEMGGSEPLDIARYAFQNTKLTTIKFPNRINEIYESGNTTSGVPVKYIADLFKNVTTLAAIDVEEGGAKFTSIDGVLYETDENGVPTILLYCPAENVGRYNDAGEPTYTIYVPNTVVLVENGSMRNIYKLKKVVFEEFEKTDPRYATQILRFGNDSVSNAMSDSNYSIIGGANSTTIYNTIERVEIPSHIAFFGGYSIGLTKNSMEIVFNPDANHIELGQRAFYASNSVTLDLPSVVSLGTSVFSNSIYLTSITFGEGSTFTEFPNYTFSSCKSLETFEIPANIRSIGTQAFAYCEKLTTVTIEEGSELLTIGNTAFAYSPMLKVIDLSNATKLQTIGNTVFSETAIESFTFPESVTDVGYNLFVDCPNLKVVTIGSTFSAGLLNKSSGDYYYALFSKIPSLEEIRINGNNPELCVEDGVLYDKAKTIVYVFPVAKDTTGYKIPETVKVIENYAFYGYTGSDLELPAGLERIGHYAFYQAHVENYFIPAGVTEIGKSAFAGATGKRIEFEENGRLNKIYLLAFDGMANLEYINLPDSLVDMGDYAFQNCKSLKSIVLPAALTYVGYYAFNNCENLEVVEMQANITYIDARAFYGTKITEITIPAAVTSIGDYAFYNCKKLVSVTFAEGSVLETLGDYVFYSCSSLEAIELPSSTKTMGVDVFRSCSSLKTAKLAGDIETIPTYTFSGCENLETLILPEKLISIESNAFAGFSDKFLINDPGCISLKSIVIPATVTNIGDNAFAGCDNLESVVFADGSAMEVLGDDLDGENNIFKDLTKLKTVVLPANLKQIGSHVFENTAIGELTLPATLESIGNYAFANCDNITFVDIFGNVTYLGDYAFYDCDSLEVANTSFGLEYFGGLAFAYCEKLTNAYIPATVNTLGANPYAGCSGVKSFVLDPDNKEYVMDESGVLYDVTMYTILYYPASITTENVVLADTVYDIAAGAFSGATMKSITIPRRLETVDASTFKNCPNLTSVIIEDGITSIGDSAFENCEKLNNVTVPSTVDYVGNYAFAGCTALSDFTFEDKDETENAYTLGTHIFFGCKSITQIIMPNKHVLTAKDASASAASVAAQKNGAIPSYMFAETGLVNAVIPESVVCLSTIGVFNNCTKLETISFEATELNYKRFGAYLFAGCTKIREIEIPQGGTDPIGGSGPFVFGGCTSLEKITIHYKKNRMAMIPSSSDMFYGCTSLKEVVIYEIPSSGGFRPRAIGGAIGDGTGSSGSEVLGGFSYVGPRFFDGCTSLETVRIAEGFILGENAFRGCTSLSEIEYYDSNADGSINIGTFNPYALDGCTSMESFTVPSIRSATNFGEGVFNGWTADQTIYLSNKYSEITRYLTNKMFKGCNAKVYDSEGTLLVINPEDGSVIETVPAN